MKIKTNRYMKKFLVTLVLYISLISCSPYLDIGHDADKTVNISNYKTYSWLNETAIESRGLNPLYYNELTDKRIKKAVDSQLQSKGYTLVKEKGALELHYHIIVENKTYPSLEPRQYIGQLQKATDVNYKEGTLIIDIMKPGENDLVWRGYATGIITYETTSKPEEAINYAVAKIFKSFPQCNQH